MWTGIPVKKMTEEESARLLQMEDALHGRIVGQNESIKDVSRSIRRTFAGIKDPNRLAEYLFGNQDAMIRLDMSEYMERHTVSRLKAHPDVFNIMLQILEDGQLTDAQGRTVDFKNVVLIMTSNVGAQTINKSKSLGFGSDEAGLSYK